MPNFFNLAWSWHCQGNSGSTYSYCFFSYLSPPDRFPCHSPAPYFFSFFYASSSFSASSLAFSSSSCSPSTSFSFLLVSTLFPLFSSFLLILLLLSQR